MHISDWSSDVCSSDLGRADEVGGTLVVLQTKEATMSEPPKLGSAQAPQRPWNKGKLVGAKPPLQPKHVWSISTRLQLDGRLRDLVLSNLAVDSKLHACDLVRPRSDRILEGKEWGR